MSRTDEDVRFLASFLLDVLPISVGTTLDRQRLARIAGATIRPEPSRPLSPILKAKSEPHNFGPLPPGYYVADVQGEPQIVNSEQAESSDFIFTYGGIPMRLGL